MRWPFSSPIAGVNFPRTGELINKPFHIKRALPGDAAKWHGCILGKMQQRMRIKRPQILRQRIQCRRAARFGFIDDHDIGIKQLMQGLGEPLDLTGKMMRINHRHNRVKIGL